MLKAFSFKDFRAAVSHVLILMMIASFSGVLFVRPTKAIDLISSPPVGPCYGIIGQGKKVLVPPVTGVANSGVVHFDSDPDGLMGSAPALTPVDPQYKACVVDQSGVGTGPFQVEGWAWDDNLGWISFYCPPGAGATNTGVACSNASYTGGYGVTIDPDTGIFSGYAWGDNTGWISFNNPGFSHVDVDTTTMSPKCQGYVYSTTPPDPSCPAHTKSDTAAWSDRVGWVDFDGIIIPWYTLTKLITDAQVTVTLDPDPTTSGKVVVSPITQPAPLGNGSDPYVLRVRIIDKNGLPVDLPRYTVTITPEWSFDTVKKDQTDTSITLALEAPCSLNPLRAVSKPCLSTALPETPGGSGNYEANITSKAPTSNMNALYDASTGHVLFSYEAFSAPSTKASPSVEANNLQLQDVQISVWDNDARACAYGLNAACDPKTRYPNDAIGPLDLSFRPMTEVTRLDDPQNINYLNLTVGQPEYLNTAGTGSGNVTFNAGIEGLSGTDASNLQFDFDTNGDSQIIFLDDSSNLGLISGDAVPPQMLVGMVLRPTKSVSQYGSGEYIWTQVADPTGATYYSNKLPRVTGSTFAQPIAVFRGNIYSSGATSTTTSVQPLHSLGDVTTNILRDNIFRNVSNIIAGALIPTKGDYVRIDWDAVAGFIKIGGTGSIVPLLPEQDTSIPQVYYANGDVHIGQPSCSSPLTWNGERTIISTGGSIYIDCDLYNSAGGLVQKPKLGIIALKDLTASSSDQAMEGNVYIRTDVKNIQANIFADGSVFSYVDDVTHGIAANGEPNFNTSSLTDYQNATKYNQLFIEGSIASQNTVGGSTLNPPIIGNGKALSGSPSDAIRSQFYDLNFLREYVGQVKRSPNGDALHSDNSLVGLPPDQLHLNKVNGTPFSKYDIDPSQPGVVGDLIPPQEIDPVNYHYATGLDPNLYLGSTYIYFDPPTPTLPGFNAQAGGEVKQLAQ